MKYSIETTPSGGAKETLEINSLKFERLYMDSGSAIVPITKSLEEQVRSVYGDCELTKLVGQYLDNLKHNQVAKVILINRNREELNKPFTFRILKFRTIAFIYPHYSLELEVLLEDGTRIYPNLDVNPNGEKEEYYEDSFWVYKCPMTDVDWNNVEKYEVNMPTENFVALHNELIDFWNRNPRFADDHEWKTIK